MKAIKIKQLVYLFLAGIFAISCGEETIELDYEEYTPKELSDNDGSVSYTDLTTFPVIGDISSEAPVFEVDGAYKFVMSTIEAPVGSTFNKSKFTIDGDTGVITYENAGELSPGLYTISVALGNTLGYGFYHKVYGMEVNAVPVTLQVDNPTVDAGIFQTGVVSTVSYTDTSGNGLITSVEYALVDAPTGFSIDENSGEISKSNPAASGPNNITVKITTNLGTIIEENICVVTVGESPTLDYVQMDGTTPLTNVVMSPWTAYTTAAPELVGMIATSYDIVLPAELVDGSVVANLDGTISVLADQNLAVGTHSLGVIVTNAGGNTVTFEDLFTITVENRWEVTDLFNDTFNDGTTGFITPNNLVYPSYSGYSIGAASSAWYKAVISHATKPTVEGIRIQNPGTNQHYLVKSIDISVVRALRISFGEQLGYNQGFVDAHKRGLYVGESTSDLDGGSFDPSNWVEIMADSDPRWTGGPTWASRVPGAVNNIDIDLSTISGNTLKLTWFIGGAAVAKNGQYVIDYCNAEYAVAFAAEEM